MADHERLIHEPRPGQAHRAGEIDLAAPVSPAAPVRAAEAGQEEATSPAAGGPGGPDWVAPYYDLVSPDRYHTSSHCPVGAAIPQARRRLDVAAMRSRLPGW